MGGKPPDLHGRLVILGQILGPNHFAVGDVQTKQIAHGAQGVDFAVLNHGRGPRSGWVLQVISAVVFMLPENVAGRVFEAEHALFAGDLVLGESARGVVHVAR